MKIAFTQSARRHRVGKRRALDVIAHTEPITVTLTDGTTGLKWVGTDARGLELDIRGLIKADRRTGEDLLLIIHVQPTTYPKGESNEN